MNLRSSWSLRVLAAAAVICALFAARPLSAQAATPLTSANFDSKAYADQYPDLKAAFGYDHAKLWNHYITSGVRENRKVYATNGDEGFLDPNAALTKENFDHQRYANDYPDLKAAFGTDKEKLWNHYQNNGIRENRKAYVIGAPVSTNNQVNPNTTTVGFTKNLTYENFDYFSYANDYADLKAAFGYNRDRLWNHYQNFGKNEGRTAWARAQGTGIDVSSWQGAIDWNAVKGAGINYAIIRLGYRGSQTALFVQDDYFQRNIQNATAAGVKVGIYFVTQAVNEAEAIEEANYCLSRISGYRVTLPVFLDVERSGGRGDTLDTASRTAVIKAFCQRITQGGYRAGVYANKNWMTNYIDMSQLTNYAIWLAQYYEEPTWTATKVDIWQYKSSGRLPGIGGRVDMNRFFTNY